MLLGQKIIHTYPQDYDPPPSSSSTLPQVNANTGLRARGRGCRAELRIITEDQVEPSRTLRKRTSSITLPAVSAVQYTPNTCNTFGIPNPTHSRSTRPDFVILSTRRHSRYNHAQQSLISRSKQTSSEPSPEELKIRALEEVAGNLRAYARDAQERVVEIRQRLVDRTIDPDCYKSLQRERWREERRQLVMKERLKVVQDQLVSVSATPSNLTQRTVDKRQANLARFFDRSPTRASLRFRSPPTFQTRTITKTTPLSLRCPPPVGRVPPAPLSIKVLPKPREPLYVRRKQPEQSIKSPIEMTSSISTATTDTGYTSVSSLPTLDDSDDELSIIGEGYASIYSPTFFDHRSKADIIAEMEEVTIPAYAMDLLEDLNYIYDEIRLTSELRCAQGNKITFVESRSSTSHDPSTPTEKSIKPKKSSSSFASPTPVSVSHTSVPLLAIPETSSTSSIRRHAPAVSMGSFFHKEQENIQDSSLVSRHSLSPATPTPRPRGLLRKKSMASANVLTPTITSPSPNLESDANPVRRRPTIASRIRRPFSMLIRN